MTLIDPRIFVCSNCGKEFVLLFDRIKCYTYKQQTENGLRYYCRYNCWVKRNKKFFCNNFYVLGTNSIFRRIFSADANFFNVVSDGLARPFSKRLISAWLIPVI